MFVVSKKISSYLWLLFQIKSYLSLQHRVLFCNAYVKPHFEYCCVMWGNSFNSNLHKIEKLQRRACKLILSWYRVYIIGRCSKTIKYVVI